MELETLKETSETALRSNDEMVREFLFGAMVKLLISWRIQRCHLTTCSCVGTESVST